MILFFGVPSEPPMRLAIEAAQRRGLGHVIVAQRSMQHADLTLDLAGGRASGLLELDGARYELEAFAGVYVRAMEVGTLPPLVATRHHSVADLLEQERATAFQRIFLDWLELTPARVANRTSAMSSNASKPYQARLIEACGLRTPTTLVTNDPALVRAFAAEHGRVVYKSISGTRSIVRVLDAGAVRRLERVRRLVTQFQAFVPGVDVRVHVVGEELHATEIVSDAADYRYADRDGARAELAAFDLPADVADRCRAVSRALGLPLCGIDLRRTPEGEYVCFEANPMPAYAYYQLATGQPIADSLVGWLSEDAHGAGRRELDAG